jgi:hypothetical protein
MTRIAIVALAAISVAGCAHLGQVIQPPIIQQADGRQSEISLIAPSLRHPVGGVQLRLWANVANPNPIGLTLSRLAGTLAIEGSRAADVNFPLGLPLAANGDAIVPLDIEVGFANLPGLADLLPGALSRGAVQYQLNGSMAVDAGPLGQPSFGPMLLMQGSVQTRR